jgi:hypothetical protein
MYPYTQMFRYGPNHLDIQPVIITGYTDAISAGAFHHLSTHVAYTMAHGAYKSWEPYKFAWFRYETEMEQALVNLKSVKQKPMKLMDWYKKIGYKHKTKKFNGLTLRQHILKCMKESREAREANGEQ